MGYYYTIKEYASIKGFNLSLQEETEVVASATVLSNQRGIPINKVYCSNTNKDIHCYASRILQETFKPLGKCAEKPSKKKRTPASAQ